MLTNIEVIMEGSHSRITRRFSKYSEVKLTIFIIIIIIIIIISNSSSSSSSSSSEGKCTSLVNYSPSNEDVAGSGEKAFAFLASATDGSGQSLFRQLYSRKESCGYPLNRSRGNFGAGPAAMVKKRISNPAGNEIPVIHPIAWSPH
jgi:hypothetical protein